MTHKHFVAIAGIIRDAKANAITDSIEEEIASEEMRLWIAKGLAHLLASENKTTLVRRKGYTAIAKSYASRQSTSCMQNRKRVSGNRKTKAIG